MRDDYVTRSEFEDAMGMINRSFDKVVSKDDFKTKIDPMKQDISTLKEDVSVLKQDVSDLKADMGYVKDKLNVIGNMMQQFLEKFSDIPERVARLERDRWG